MTSSPPDPLSETVIPPHQSGLPDLSGMPVGWVDVTGWGGPVPEGRLHRLGTLAGPDASARTLLDAALSSPSGRGVVVEEGRVVGTVTAEDVLAATRHVRSGQP